MEVPLFVYVFQDLLVVYGASVAQLKSMCTALPECDGFNSDGWIKGRISSKKRATLDLYVKQVSHLQSSTGVQIWDHDSGVFQSRIADYNEMEAGMKMYLVQIQRYITVFIVRLHCYMHTV